MNSILQLNRFLSALSYLDSVVHLLIWKLFITPVLDDTPLDSLKPKGSRQDHERELARKTLKKYSDPVSSSKFYSR